MPGPGPSSRAADHRIERRVLQAVRRQAAAARLPDPARGLGLAPAAFAALLVGVGEQDAVVEPCARDAEPVPRLLQPLVALLWAHRARDTAWSRLMAGAIGSACFGEHHLWQDLGLAGRGEVSDLLNRHFPALAAANTRGLRWKRHLFLRLGDALGIADLAPPKCEGCDDVQVCHAPAGESPVRIVMRTAETSAS